MLIPSKILKLFTLWIYQFISIVHIFFTPFTHGLQNRIKTFDNHAVYCGTKFAVHAITENIRKEVASSNVRVITIAPGVVETPLLSHTTDENIKENYNEWKKL